MSQTTVKEIERVYFHWGNGGLSFIVNETTRRWTSVWGEKPEEQAVKVGISYRMEVEASYHGGVTTFSFDLGSTEIVGWLHEMTGRLLKRMMTQPNEGRSFVFEYAPSGRVSVKDGEPADYSFRYRDGQLKQITMVMAEASGDGFAVLTQVEKTGD